MKNLLRACAFTGSFLFCLSVTGMDTLDSLRHALEQKNLNDSIKLNLFLKISTHPSVTNPDTIIKYANQALQLAKTDQQRNRAFYALGDAHRLKGELSISTSYYLKSLRIYKNKGNLLGEAATLSSLGAVYIQQKNLDLSLLYYSDALIIYRNEKDSINLAVTLLNTGEVFRDLDMYDSALNFYQESKLIFNLQHYNYGTAYTMGNIGLVYAEQGKYDLAEQNMNEAIQILEKMGDRYPIAVYETSLAEIYAKRGNVKKALLYAEHALSIGQEEGLKEQIRDASLTLSDLYKATKSYEKAYHHQSQYLIYRDSINNEEVIRQMADLRTEYEVGQKQTEIDLKQAEVELLEEEAKVNRLMLWAGLIVMTLLIGLSIVLYKLYRLKIKTVRIVRERREVIEQQKNDLDALNKTKDKFFSLISHDLRGPISNFTGVVQLIQQQIANQDYDELRRIGLILEDSSFEISALLDNLLDWAMSQQGHFPYKPEEVSAEDICNPSLRVLRNSAKAKQITMTEEIISDLMLQVDINSASTIIRNLLNNALKFTSEGGKVTLSVAQSENFAVFTVQDTGIGIAKDKMQTLFGFHGNRKQWGTKGEKGVGLGLNLVHEFILLNHGKIEVDSEEGVGTTFQIYLPLSN
ncbi:tetratricopeptide repeat-containing sensor histidine kinase [Reichenbachiella agarivorans]|uniref:histidine kinase n=1 Tax=Reichenbachiella agarivorans TaxID=2979464 RepID=A0ABY6CVF0_9BACT|nr:tetratricopeptide repeat-containing sensor histidine kinase [Reichenbachiella agarivorans]UXP33985.1 tetratricopeptide repeat-containing sensor histidine kinase [Reichenbachiella agarivorans]